MRATSFSLDSLGAQVFEGYTSDDVWNGWARPLFTFEVAQQLVLVCRERGQSASYDEAIDAFIFMDEASGEREEFGAVEIEGRKLYAVGVGSWIWEECAPMLQTSA